MKGLHTKPSGEEARAAAALFSSSPSNFTPNLWRRHLTGPWRHRILKPRWILRFLLFLRIQNVSLMLASSAVMTVMVMTAMMRMTNYHHHHLQHRVPRRTPLGLFDIGYNSPCPTI